MRKISSFLISFLLAVSAHAGTFNLFSPATGVLKGSSSTYVTTAAAYGDITTLWSGTCNSGTFLRADGTCQAVSTGTVTSVALTVPSGFSVTGSPITTSGTLDITGTLNVSAGGTGAGTLTGPLKGNGTSAFTAAVAADIVSLWTGTCVSSTDFLAANGTCNTAGGGASGANPTATIGLTAVNGGASTFLRSDGALALSQAIAPTWSAQHIFGLSGSLATPSVVFSSSRPSFQLNETDASSNKKNWFFEANGGQFTGYIENDAGNSAIAWITVSRTATTSVDSVNFTATQLQANGLPVYPPINCTTACDISTMAVGQTAYVYKAADTSRSSNNTLSDDPDLKVTNAVSGAAYNISVNLRWTMGSGAGGFKFGPVSSVTITGGSAGYDSASFYTGTGSGCGWAGVVGNIGIYTTSTAINTCTPGAATDGNVSVLAPMRWMPTAATGTFSIQWAQDTSNGTATVMKAGSNLTVTRIN
jgi:hypothetical protein